MSWILASIRWLLFLLGFYAPPQDGPDDEDDEDPPPRPLRPYRP